MARGGRVIDITGQRFGRWVVREWARNDPNQGAIWSCLCACGQVGAVPSKSLRAGRSKSCGCLKREREVMPRKSRGHTGSGVPPSRTYTSWYAAIQRCENPNNKAFALYGGRGVRVCRKWRGSFAAFLFDMGERPEGMTLDRINVDGDYEPNNCRWATYKQQAASRRSQPPGRIHEDLTGQRFGKLVARELAGADRFGAKKWLFDCDCGYSKVIGAHDVKRGNTRSCGCLRRTSRDKAPG